MLVLATALGVILGPMWGAGVLPGWWGLFALVALGPIAYLLLLVGVGLSARGSPAQRARYVAVLVTMHFAWGIGFVRGMPHGGGETVDRSRHL
jgi:hypothetical protein